MLRRRGPSDQRGEEVGHVLTEPRFVAGVGELGAEADANGRFARDLASLLLGFLIAVGAGALSVAQPGAPISPPLGADALRAKAEAGDARSQVELGLRYIDGVGVRKDFTQAAEWFRKAAMQGDAHNTNCAENFEFFLNQNNPTNFERVWNQAYYLYRKVGSIGHQPVPFEQVMDPSVIEKLRKEPKYASQTDEYRQQLTPKTVKEIEGAEQILTNTVVVKFFPNSWDLYKKVPSKLGGKNVEELYDPSVDLTLDEIAKLAGQFGAAHILIEGHADSSMKGQVPAALVKELSMNRANSIKEALLQKYRELPPNQFAVKGMGWDVPADPADPDNHVKNRRVEIKVFSAEHQ
jgi:outer membrane protein OmpA-like peptidoglycan-associated protein